MQNLSLSISFFLYFLSFFFIYLFLSFFCLVILFLFCHASHSSYPNRKKLIHLHPSDIWACWRSFDPCALFWSLCALFSSNRSECFSCDTKVCLWHEGMLVTRRYACETKVCLWNEGMLVTRQTEAFDSRDFLKKSTLFSEVYFEVGKVSFEIGKVSFEVGKVSSEVGKVSSEVGKVSFECKSLFFQYKNLSS